MAAAENLTIVFVDMAGYTARTARQSRGENHALIRDFSGVIVPLIARFGGKRIKTIGDAFLITFRSPTDAVRCGMAMQDGMAAYNAQHSPSDPIRIRVALNVGEVRVEKNDVFGEAVNIAARVEELTPPGEIYLTGVVYLSMNKAEVASEHIGERALKGIPEKIRIFRVPTHQVARLRPAGEAAPVAGDLPFGGMHKLSADAPVFTRVSDRVLRARYTDWGAKAQQVRARTWAIGVAALGAIALLVAGASWLMVPEHAGVLSSFLRSGATEGAREALREAHSAYLEHERTAAADGFAHALELNPELRHDIGLAAELVGTLGWAGEGPAETIRKFQSPELLFELARRTAQPGRKGAQRAVALLNELGQGERVDLGALTLTEFSEATTCEDRLASIKRLRQLKEPRALAPLRDFQHAGLGFMGGVFGKDKDACLRQELKATIAELEKLPPATPAS